jgi:hypothetical protein
VAEQHLGRRLRHGEVVHHLNQRKADNRPCNLMVFASGGAHRSYHDGRAVAPVWDGRTVDVERPAERPAGPRVRVRVVGTRPVRWRSLGWLQGDLKQLSPASLARLKESIRRNGLIDGFRVWKDRRGRVWILDGHQRRRAMAELESEGLRLPDLAPAQWLDCKSRAEAGEFVLLFSSQYGELDADRTVEFMRRMGTELAALPGVQMPTLDMEALRRELAGELADLDAADAALADTRPADGFTTFTIEDESQATLAAAALNRLGIAHHAERVGGTEGGR